MWNLNVLHIFIMSAIIPSYFFFWESYLILIWIIFLFQLMFCAYIFSFNIQLSENENYIILYLLIGFWILLYWIALPFFPKKLF